MAKVVMILAIKSDGLFNSGLGKKEKTASC